MHKIKAILGLGCLLAVPALAETSPSPALLSRFLREDLALAKTSSLYFVIQMKTGVMSLRAGGVILKEWKVADVRAWGAPHPLEPLTVEKKSTLFPPKRAEIIPTAEGEEGQPRSEPAKADKKKDDEKPKTPELEALELKDMPASFMFLMSDSARVYFRPRARKLLPRIASFGHSFSWYFWVPLKNLWLRLNKRPFSAIDIKLENPEDCQSIYWSLAEGAQGLIFPL